MDEFSIQANSSPFDATRIPHYYGDYVRLIFIIVAGITALATPIYGAVLPIGTSAQIIGIIILVMLAGMTNPHGEVVLWADAFASAIGVLFIEQAAILEYTPDDISMLFIREVVVLLLLIAMYYSVKTVRALANHKIGHPDEVGEFDESEDE